MLIRGRGVKGLPRVRRSTSRATAVPALAAFLAAGCLSTAPYETREGDYVRRVVPETPSRFGSLSVGIIPRADFYGNIDGLEPGHGATVTFPLSKGIVASAVVVVIVAALAYALAEGGGGSWSGGGGGGGGWSGSGGGSGGPVSGEEESSFWHSGVGDQSHEIISELSFDFTFSGTRHQDRDFGGKLDYFAFLLGMRLGGPRRYVPRYYLSGGWGVYSFNYDNRAYARVTGPYVGGGLEWFPQPDVALGLDYKVHYYFGDDDAGVPVDGACGQLSAQATLYW
jgi:hypothetical protein